MSSKKYEIHPKTDDHARWYQTVLTVSDMIDYSTVGGCYVLKPNSIKIWDKIRSYLDGKICSINVDNYYFPLFVTKSNLEKESNHFSDFTPEVAWVSTEDSSLTNTIKTDTDVEHLISKLKAKGILVDVRRETDERYAIRPTSETIIYPHFASWIKRDGRYPKINQWANVVRWETKTTQPFIRSREFLWQEGHTCYQNERDALAEVYTVLKFYKDTYETLLAVPVIAGTKTKSETFPGAVLTTTIEGFLPDSGKGIQSATSHFLGDKFSKMFNIKGPDGEYVQQNSWGLTTRSIGVMVMTHSDDRGLVLPPAVAPVQVVIVACGLNSKTTQEDRDKVDKTLRNLYLTLITHGISAVFDDDLSETPGMKFNKWEVKGVPLRIEYGPKDMQNDTVSFVRRDHPTKTKQTFKFSDVDPAFVSNILSVIQTDMFNRALDRLKSSIVYCADESQVVEVIGQKKMALIDWSESNDDGDLESRLKQACADADINSTKILCIPTADELTRLGINDNHRYALFGRSY